MNRKTLGMLFAPGLLIFVVAGCTEKAVDPIPSDLAAIESLGEDAFDQALAGDAAAMQGLASDIGAAWARYRPRATSDHVPESALQELDAAIANLTSVAASGDATVIALGRAANAISAPMDAIYDVYGPIVPAAVLRLDYLGREVQLDGMETNFALASDHMSLIDATWLTLRPQVVSAGGEVEAADMDTTIADQRAAIDANDGASLADAAAAQLEVVDAIESVFAKANADPAD